MSTERKLSDLALVLAVFAATMAVGFAVKQPCASGDWGDERQYNRLCYSDIVPLYYTEHLESDEALAAAHNHPVGRLPYLDPCPEGGGQCDEYPVGTMYTMRLAAYAADDLDSFYYANVVLLLAAGIIAVVALVRVTGLQAIYFAAAPTLLIYGLLNWDLVPVAAATAGTALFLSQRKGRDVGAGVLFGVGAAAKLYPALLVIPFAWQRIKEGAPRRGALLAASAAGTWLALNLPFALAARDSWLNFFRFNTQRPADFDSLWYIGCRRISETPMFCPHTDNINKWSLAAFVVLAAMVCIAYVIRHPSAPVWHLGFPILIVFLLTNKVYSPQFSLWLLPWFALAFPRVWAFAAFQVADAAVFITRFTWFGRIPSGGVSSCPTDDPCAQIFSWYERALLLRAAILIAIVVAFVIGRRRTDDEEEEQPAAPQLEPAPA